MWSTLLFWHKWLVESLRHADVATWPSVALKFYTTADPLATAIAVSLVIAALCFLLSLPTNNHSFVSTMSAGREGTLPLPVCLVRVPRRCASLLIGCPQAC